MRLKLLNGVATMLKGHRRQNLHKAELPVSPGFGMSPDEMTELLLRVEWLRPMCVDRAVFSFRVNSVKERVECTYEDPAVTSQ